MIAVSQERELRERYVRIAREQFEGVEGLLNEPCEWVQPMPHKRDEDESWWLSVKDVVDEESCGRTPSIAWTVR